MSLSQSQQVSDFKSDVVDLKSKVSSIQSESRQAHPPSQLSTGMPSVSDFFGAVESAIRTEVD